MRPRKSKKLSWGEALAFCKTWPSEELHWESAEFDFGNTFGIAVGVYKGPVRFRRAIKMTGPIPERELRLARLKMLTRIWHMRARYVQG